jgi:uncharacterized membrane protein
MAKVTHSRLFLLGFAEADIARYVLQLIKNAIAAKEITVSDWAMIVRGEGREAEITTDKKVDPGGARGAGFGGLAGVVVAGLSGPIGVGAIVAGAAIGGITAALKDSGLKDGDLQSISNLMAEGRSGLVISVPLDDAATFESFMSRNTEFHAAQPRLSYDIVPGRTLQDVVDSYVASADDR